MCKHKKIQLTLKPDSMGLSCLNFLHQLSFYKFCKQNVQSPFRVQNLLYQGICPPRPMMMGTLLLLLLLQNVIMGGGRLICSFNTFSLDADRLLPYCIFTPLKILIFLDTSQSYCKYCQRKSRFFIIQVCDTIHY